MNRQEQLLKNYILSEIYNIEKESFLLETADLLEEGKIWDWTKSKFSSFKDIFRLSQEDKQKFDSDIAKARRAGKTERAERLESIKTDIENKRFSNYSKMILSLIVSVSLYMYGNLDNVDVVSHGNADESNISKIAEASDIEDNDIVAYWIAKGIPASKMGSLAAELDAQNPGDNPVLRAFEGLIKSDKVSLYGMPPGQSISKEAFVKYLAWEFNNERPKGMNMYEHYKKFIAAVIRDGEDDREQNREAEIEQRKEDTAAQAALLGLDEGTLLFNDEEISALSEDERSTYIDNIIQGLEGEEFMNRYIKAYTVDDNNYHDPRKGPIFGTRKYLENLADHPKIDRATKKEILGRIGDLYALSNVGAFENDPRTLPIEQLEIYVDPELFSDVYHWAAGRDRDRKDN